MAAVASLASVGFIALGGGPAWANSEVCEEREELTRLVIENGLDVNEKDDKGDTALIMASVLGCVEEAKALIDAGADVDARSDSRYTALMFASIANHPEIVRMLIDAGAKSKCKR